MQINAKTELVIFPFLITFLFLSLISPQCLIARNSGTIELKNSGIIIEPNINWTFVSDIHAHPYVSEVAICRHPLAKLQGLIQIRIENSSALLNIPLYYFQSGFIQLSDEFSFDTTAVLAKYKENYKQLGITPPENWISKPKTTTSGKSIIWGFRFKSATYGFSGIYHIIKPGRFGFMLLNIPILTKHTFEIDDLVNELEQGMMFSDGHRYEDFQSTRDQRSLVSIDQLILGGHDLNMKSISLINYWKIGFFIILVIFVTGAPRVFTQFKKSRKSTT